MRGGAPKIQDVVPGPWDSVIAWVDRELNRLWKARGAFPGLGSALSAFGIEHGNLIAYAIAAAQGLAKKEWTESPWDVVDAVFDDPELIPGGVASSIGPTYQSKWRKLPKKRRALLELISRFSLSAEQATRYWVAEVREAAGIGASDDELLANPYSLYELDRRFVDAITVETVDRGLSPDPIIQKAFPVPKPSALRDAIDPRRVRALLLDTLETAATDGHTLLPRSWTVNRIRERPLNPPCLVDEDVLAIVEDSFASLVANVALKTGKPAFQLDRYVATRDLIARAVRKRHKGARHAAGHDWAKLVDTAIRPAPSPEGGGARRRAARPPREVGSAGRAVRVARIGAHWPGRDWKDDSAEGALRCAGGRRRRDPDLAPTGKARVRLETQTDLRGAGKTLAQFLSKLNWYDGATARTTRTRRGRSAATTRP